VIKTETRTLNKNELYYIHYMKIRYKHISILSLQMTNHYTVVKYFANEILIIKHLYNLGPPVKM